MSAIDLARNVPRLSLNRAEVALAIGVSPNTVDVMVSQGRLPRPRRWNSRKVWLVHEVLACLNEWPEDGAVATDGDDEDWSASA